MINILDIDTPQRAVTVAQAAIETGRSKQAVKKWIQRGLITPIVSDSRGYLLDWRDVMDVDRETRHRRASLGRIHNVPSESIGRILPATQNPRDCW